MATITNMLLNPSVEVDTSNIASQGDTTLSRSTAWSASGSASLRIAIPGSVANEGAYFSTGSGLNITPAVVSGGMVAAGVGDAYIKIRAIYTDATSDTSPNTVVALDPGGVRAVVEGFVPNATKTVSRLVIFVQAFGDATPRTINADAAMIVEGDAIPDYFDGDSPGAVWTGTPHASTSVLTLPDTPTRTLHPVLKIGSPHIGPMRVGERN